MAKTGWEELTETETERTPEAHREALEVDLSALEEGSGLGLDQRRTHEESFLRLVELLVRDMLWYLLHRDEDKINSYRQILSDLLSRHPRMKRLRDLDPIDRAACRLDGLFLDLLTATGLFEGPK